MDIVAEANLDLANGYSANEVVLNLIRAESILVAEQMVCGVVGIDIGLQQLTDLAEQIITVFEQQTGMEGIPPAEVVSIVGP